MKKYLIILGLLPLVMCGKREDKSVIEMQNTKWNYDKWVASKALFNSVCHQDEGCVRAALREGACIDFVDEVIERTPFQVGRDMHTGYAKYRVRSLERVCFKGEYKKVLEEAYKEPSVICNIGFLMHIAKMDLKSAALNIDTDVLHATMNACDASLMTPLMWYAWHGNVKMVCGLLLEGADEELTNIDGHRAVDLVAPDNTTLLRCFDPIVEQISS